MLDSTGLWPLRGLERLNGAKLVDAELAWHPGDLCAFPSYTLWKLCPHCALSAPTAAESREGRGPTIYTNRIFKSLGFAS